MKINKGFCFFASVVFFVMAYLLDKLAGQKHIAFLTLQLSFLFVTLPYAFDNEDEKKS